MSEDDPKPTLLARVPSGIPGFDSLLQGGFLRGGVYMVMGRPGAGKTILGNQVCFEHVAAGGRAVFLTLLTESHARLIAQLHGMDFFRAEQVGTSLSYVSGYEALEKDNLKGLLALVRRVVRDHKANLLVLDGLVTANAVAASELEMKKFIHELQVLVELVGCTTLLLTGANTSEDEYPQRTMVDGLVHLSHDLIGLRMARTIEVAKFRGGPILTGRHQFEITNAGISIYPRIESTLGRTPPLRPDRKPAVGFGIEGLDHMLGGGLRADSVSLLLGAAGTGKTILGLSFLTAGAKQKIPGLYLGFFETPEELSRKADAVGIGLSPHLRSGLIETVWQPPLDLIADALAGRVLATVRRLGVQRLFIDGIAPLQDAVMLPERAGRFLNALCNELRSLGVSTILSDETRDLFGPAIESPVSGLTAMVDNIIFLRHVELRARLHRIVSVMKMREGRNDPTLRQFVIGKRGIEVSSTLGSAEAILTGVARVRAPGRVRAPATPKRKSRSRRR